MSRKFETVRHYFDCGFWSVSRLKKAVEAGWITAEEFALIAGTEFDEK